MPHPGRLSPGKATRYPLYRRLGGSQGRSGQVRKISPPPGFHPRTVQPVASRYTDYAIPYEGKIKVNFSLCAPWRLCGSGGLPPLILNLGTIWWWVVSLTPRSLYARERSPGTQQIEGWRPPELVWRFWRREEYFALTWNQTTITQLVSPWYSHYTGYANFM